MFNKKKCRRCGEKVSDKYKFCPICGSSINKNAQDEDWGMLGESDIQQNIGDSFMMPFGGISGKMINKMLGNMMNMLEKEMAREMVRSNSNQPAKIRPNTNIKLMINGKEIPLNNLNQPKLTTVKKVQKIPALEMSSDKLKKFSTLPKEEPETTIRRLANKVVYEINMPDVKSIKDISIISLENSIEIKALGKTKVYKKIIPISLPITNYNLEEGKLVLEMDAK